MLNIGKRGYLFGRKPSGIIKQNLKLHLVAHDPNSFSGSGTTWYDISGNEYDATWNGTMEYYYINSVDATKDGRRSFYLDTDYAFPTGLNYGNGNTISEMSVFAWVKSYFNSGTIGTWANNNWAILDFDRSEVFTFAINNTGEVQMSGSSTNNGGIGNANYDIVGTARINDFRWHYVGWTFSVADQKIVMYVDGEVDRTFTANGNMTALGAGLARWGVIGDGSERSSEISTSRNSLYYDGYISEIHFYDGKALSSDEVKKNYDATKSVYSTEEGLIVDLNSNDTNSYSGSGSLWSDISGKGNNCVLGENVTFYSATGGDPAYLHFDGSTGSYTEGPLLPLPSSFSLDCWFRGSTSQPNAYCRLITRSNNAFGNYTLAGDVNNDYVRVGYYNVSNRETSDSSITGDLKTYKWVDYTGVVDFNQRSSSSTIYLYKNGTLISSTTESSGGSAPPIASEAQGNLFIGNSGVCGDYGYGFSGDICSVKIHNKALSSTEVFNQFAEKALEVSGIVTDGLVLNLDAYFYHSEQGTTWYDTSGSGSNFTMVGTFPFVGEESSSHFSADGGSTSNYFIKNSFSHPTETVSVELWVSSPTGAAGGIYSYAVSSSNNVYPDNDNLLYMTSNDLRLWGPWGFIDTGYVVGDGNWKHIIRTSNRETGEEKLYVNGTPIFTTSLSAGTNYTSGGIMILGQEQDSLGGGFTVLDAFEGRYSVFRMYDKVLSTTEVEQNFNALRRRYGAEPLAVVTNGLVLNLDAGDTASYPGSGTTWYDTSGNNANFTMTGTLSFTDEGDSSYFTSTGTTANYFIRNPFTHPTTTVTVEMWVNCDNNESEALYSYAVSGSDNNNLLFKSPNVTLWGPWGSSSSSVTIGDGNWKHIVRTSNRTTGQEILYINGTAVYTATLSAGTNYTSGGSMILAQEQDSVGGGLDAAQVLEGKYSVFRIYDRVLNSTEITQNFNALRGRYGI